MPCIRSLKENGKDVTLELRYQGCRKAALQFIYIKKYSFYEK
jgi:hypothetical protein